MGRAVAAALAIMVSASLMSLFLVNRPYRTPAHEVIVYFALFCEVPPSGGDDLYGYTYCPTNYPFGRD
jgi:hypothetical protein